MTRESELENELTIESEKEEQTARKGWWNLRNRSEPPENDQTYKTFIASCNQESVPSSAHRGDARIHSGTCVRLGNGATVLPCGYSKGPT